MINVPHLSKPLQDFWNRMTKKSQQEDFVSREQEVKNELSKLKLELKIVQDHFENETDFDLIDAHIWELKSLEVRYGQALKKAKANLRNFCG